MLSPEPAQLVHSTLHLKPRTKTSGPKASTCKQVHESFTKVVAKLDVSEKARTALETENLELRMANHPIGPPATGSGGPDVATSPWMGTSSPVQSALDRDILPMISPMLPDTPAHNVQASPRKSSAI